MAIRSRHFAEPAKNLRVLADELQARVHAISYVVVGRLLKDQGSCN